MPSHSPNDVRVPFFWFLGPAAHPPPPPFTANTHTRNYHVQGYAWQANAADDHAANEREGRSQSHLADGQWKCSWDRSLIFPVHDLKFAGAPGIDPAAARHRPPPPAAARHCAHCPRAPPLHRRTPDFDGDGIDELIATTTSASHLFHHDVAAVVEKVEATVSLLEELAALREQVAREAKRGEG